MSISVFELFTIGVGPSSSHTVGPMRAAHRFVRLLEDNGLLESTSRVHSEMFGSLGLTGQGHGTPGAVIAGLRGQEPETVDPDDIIPAMERVKAEGKLGLLGRHFIEFDFSRDLILNRRKSLPFHPNGMRFTGFDTTGEKTSERTFYSVGGGFIVNEERASHDEIDRHPEHRFPYPLDSGEQILKQAREHSLSLSEMMLRNECTLRDESEVRGRLLHIWDAMQQCVSKGCTRTEKTLPGKLNVRRRAPQMFSELTRRPETSLKDPLNILDWVNLYALAVNEENATGGRVVTAPTNGAAGIIPAVLHYYDRFVPGANEDGIFRFLLAAGAIGILFKKKASISGAEVGCQGEVGVACSMAAAGLTEAISGSILQVEEAAEIAMEHNLGLTCDPVGGLVQIPCIERNAMGAVKAINASRMARRSDGEHRVSLDRVIDTMRQTGRDMKKKYKESARGGLAVNVTEC